MALGYELIGIERFAQGRRGWLVRVYIDHTKGISLQDCERVSNHISGVLEVENPIPGRYILEVSSPGLDRPLFTLDHFARFIGHKVSVRLAQPMDARRNFTGKLERLEGHTVILVAAELEYRLPFEQIDKARLVPD